jgi:toxin-antitoxin system PIN domain toxin
MRALLDVNVLIALLDAAHVHHLTASAWLERNLHHGWASCPLTLNGCIRIMAQPAYPGRFTAREVAARLAEAMATPYHAFWQADVNPLGEEAVDWRRVLGHQQVTDVYLLALAVRHGGRLATLDARISPEAVTGASDRHLVVVA